MFIRSYFETSATRLKDGRVINKTISGNIKELEELKKDPYLYIRNYDKEDFAQSASWYAQLKQRVLGISGTFRVRKIKDTSLGFYQHGFKRVTVDCDKHGYIPDLVNTINHEYRHKYQHSLIDRLPSWLNLFIRKSEPLTAEEVILAKKLKIANKNYCQPKVDYDKYYSNFMEVDARKAASEAVSEYNSYSHKLADLFAMPDEMVHVESANNAIPNFIKKAMQEGKVTIAPPIKIAAKC